MKDRIRHRIEKQELHPKNVNNIHDNRVKILTEILIEILNEDFFRIADFFREGYQLKGQINGCYIKSPNRSAA